MDESTMTERLDERDLLGQTRGPGCYALEVRTPDAEDAAQVAWYSEFDHAPPEDALERIADASRVAYVGASGNIYSRLCDHVAGDVRKAAFLTVFRPTRVIDVWPEDTPDDAFDAEFNRAMRLVRDGFAVWQDGKLLG